MNQPQDREQTLAEWIDENVGSDAEFARRLGVSRGHLSSILQGKRGMSAELQARIEMETGGLFTGARLQRERQALKAANDPAGAAA